MSREFSVCEIETENLSEVLALVWRVFLEFQAPGYSDEGVLEFRRFIEYESIHKKLMEKKLKIWICRKENKIAGVLQPGLPAT